MSDVRLMLTCGLPGSGKTTLARRLAEEQRAVRLTKDDWLWALGTTPWDEQLGPRLEHELWLVARQILRVDRSVVLDFGLWARVERDAFRIAARELGVGVELHYLDVALDELWRRVNARNAHAPWDQCPIGRDHLEQWFAKFEAPTADELAEFDPPASTG